MGPSVRSLPGPAAHGIRWNDSGWLWICSQTPASARFAHGGWVSWLACEEEGSKVGRAVKGFHARSARSSRAECMPGRHTARGWMGGRPLHNQNRPAQSTIWPET